MGEEIKFELKPRTDDPTTVISVRIHRELLERIDACAKRKNYSRNELINLLLDMILALLKEDT